MTDDRYFAWRGGPIARSPVLLAVPHAGRDYPATLLAAARVPANVLRGLEDRYADRLVDRAVALGFPVLVATAPRALVDLNRDPADRDDSPGYAPEGGRAATGMGVFPRRVPIAGELWRVPFDPGDLEARIAQVHRPYHAALADALARTRSARGGAVLLDIHSMPRRAGRGWPRSADIVIGDRKGASAAKRLVIAAEEAVRAAGLTCARNTPYAGGYGCARHGDPAGNVHAIQVEIARDLYLDEEGAPVAAGTDRIGALVGAIAAMLSSAGRWDDREAAE